MPLSMEREGGRQILTFFEDLKSPQMLLLSCGLKEGYDVLLQPSGSAPGVALC